MAQPNLDLALQALYGRPVRVVELARLPGDASTRVYFRARIEGAAAEQPEQLIVMHLPEDAFRSDEGGEQPERTRLPFLEVAELLSERGVPVPRIYAEDLGNRVVLLEDLGDTTFELRLRSLPMSGWESLYSEAVDLLVELHERCSNLPEGSIVRERSFDRTLLDWELGHFRQWGFEALYGELAPDRSRVLERAFESVSSAIAAMPQGFVHRDYQSKNLMVGPSGELRIIDFQDAMLGPRIYDLVALLCDSYVALRLDLQTAMLKRYAALRQLDFEPLWREFWLVALHRKLKDAGRFVFIDRMRGNPSFLKWYPQSLVYVARALEHTPDLAALGELLAAVIPGYPKEVGVPASVRE